MQEQRECLVKRIPHDYEFRNAQDGQCNYVCRLCGDWFAEYEDCTP